MGNGVSAAAQIPDSVDKELARTLLGEKFDEAKFDAAATDGTIDQATFLAKVAEAAAAEASAGASAAPESGGGAGGEVAAAPVEATEAAAAAAGGDAAAASGLTPDPDKISQGDVESFHSLVRWNKDVPAIEAQLTGTPGMVHARDGKNGNYPLHIAAQNNHTELVKLLLARKADPNKQNAAGQTALHMTQTYEMTELSDLLLNAGADPELKNDDGHCAKHGLEGKQSARYGELKALVESADSAALLAFFEGVLGNPENLDKTELMKIVNFQAKKAMKANGTWTDELNQKFTEVVRAL